MRKAMLAAAVATLPFSAVAADDELVGTYKLISSTRKILDTGEVKDTYGKEPKGFIMYGRDGRMMGLIVYSERPKPESVDKITDQQRADLFRTKSPIET
jgi:Lipocalin-like domain